MKVYTTPLREWSIKTFSKTSFTFAIHLSNSKTILDGSLTEYRRHSFQTFHALTFSYPAFRILGVSNPDLVFYPNSNPLTMTLTPSPNTYTNPNPNPKYLTLILLRTPGTKRRVTKRFGCETSGTRRYCNQSPQRFLQNSRRSVAAAVHRVYSLSKRLRASSVYAFRDNFI